ncbi:MAG: tryptophan-rich sensory protein [Gloeobacteraceae cyanobacterium ES-bin-316]|nr:tryptophan-rich sensory protein [Ferruginibacter sp.]
MYTSTLNQARNSQWKMKWWHCIIIYVVANGISLIPAGFNGDEAFYNNFLQPSVAPPGWLFAPVWLINNITSLIALYIIVNLPRATPERGSIIMLEAISWILYAAFALFYFGLKSPILGAIDTIIGLTLTIAAFVRCYRVSKKAALLVAPRLAWLLLATYVSVWIALYNGDVLFGTGAWLLR